jgi:hypothetical protein
MKSFVFAFIIFTLSLCSLNTGGDFDLFSKIGNQERIKKSELEKHLNQKFPNYEDDFFGTGNLSHLGKIKAGVIEGRKNDTAFHILIVFNGSEYALVKEHPNLTFHRKGETIHQEYKLGEIYTTYKEKDTTCIRAYIETITPFKVDTLTMMFHPDMATVLQRDTLEFCSQE